MFEAISVEDLRTLFQNTVIRYDGRLVSVHAISGGRDLTLHDIVTNDRVAIRNITDKKFDFMPLPLGMINDVNGSAYWSCRVPRRQWAQGCRTDNVKFERIGRAGTGYSETLDFLGQGIVDCVNNKYPGITNVVEDLFKGTTSSRAVHKLFAISGKAFEIFYKNKKVGKLNHDNGSAEFSADYQHLKYLFEDVKWQS